MNNRDPLYLGFAVILLFLIVGFTTANWELHRSFCVGAFAGFTGMVLLIGARRWIDDKRRMPHESDYTIIWRRHPAAVAALTFPALMIFATSPVDRSSLFYLGSAAGVWLLLGCLRKDPPRQR